jgi:hypothetical protein
MMAAASGISVSSVQRIWRAYGLQPHRVRQFKLSTDPKFVAKLRDVVGLYVDPSAHAIVLSLDEKSQIQALDRTQPGLADVDIVEPHGVREPEEGRDSTVARLQLRIGELRVTLDPLDHASFFSRRLSMGSCWVP